MVWLHNHIHAVMYKKRLWPKLSSAKKHSKFLTPNPKGITLIDKEDFELFEEQNPKQLYW